MSGNINWPDAINLESRVGYSGGPAFTNRSTERGTPYYAGQSLERYVRVATLGSPESQVTDLRALITDEIRYLRDMHPNPQQIAGRLEGEMARILAKYVPTPEEKQYSLADLEYAIRKCTAEGFQWSEESEEDKKNRLEQAATYNEPPMDERDKHLLPCDFCEEHVGIGEYDDNWGFTPPGDRSPVKRVCLWCAGKVSIGHRGQPKFEEVLRQRGADLAANYTPVEYP